MREAEVTTVTNSTRKLNLQAVNRHWKADCTILKAALDNEKAIQKKRKRSIGVCKS